MGNFCLSSASDFYVYEPYMAVGTSSTLYKWSFSSIPSLWLVHTFCMRQRNFMLPLHFFGPHFKSSLELCFQSLLTHLLSQCLHYRKLLSYLGILLCGCIHLCVKLDLHESVHVYMNVCRQTYMNLYVFMYEWM